MSTPLFQTYYVASKLSEETPDWQKRMSEELCKLSKKLTDIYNAIYEDPNMKMTPQEGVLLSEQYYAMKGYFNALISRCRFYGLVHMEPQKITHFREEANTRRDDQQGSTTNRTGKEGKE